MRFTTLMCLALTAFATVSNAHSWPEYLEVIAASGPKAGKPVGKQGFIRAHPPNRNDELLQGKILSLNGETMCRPSQQTATYDAAYPMLQASPGDIVQVSHTENGHTTKPTRNEAGEIIQITGEITYYLLTDEIAKMTLGEFNKRLEKGEIKPFSRQNYDDQLCAEAYDNQTPLNLQRHKALGLSNTPEGLNTNIPCKTSFKIPENAKTGAPMPILWVWDYSGKNGNIPGNIEVYTSCFDVNIVPGTRTKAASDGMGAKMMVDSWDGEKDFPIKTLGIPSAAPLSDSKGQRPSTQSSQTPTKRPQKENFETPQQANPATPKVLSTSEMMTITATLPVPTATATAPADTNSTPPLSSQAPTKANDSVLRRKLQIRSAKFRGVRY